LANVLIIGAGGLIGSVLQEGLRAGHSIRGLDRRRVDDRRVRRADMRRLKSVAPAFEGVEAVVDLAVRANFRAPWREVARHNVPATMNALEAARRFGVQRYIFASSNHVTGMYERDDPYCEIVAGRYDGLDPAKVPKIDSRFPIRPDGPYGIGKALGEAACRYYSDDFGLSAICLRIGTVNAGDRPENPRHFATHLTHADLVHLVDCAIRASSELRFGVYYGVSDNKWRFWDIAEPHEAIGYVPQDNAERFRSVDDSAPGG
jgi:nucleoside-diphosphate-sugar epimerase